MSQPRKKLLQYVRRGRVATTAEATAPEPAARRSADDEPAVSRYDALTVEEVLAHLGDLTPVDLAALGDHERAHQNRARVLADIDARLGSEPWPGYDELDVPGVRSGLEHAGREQLGAVLAYERAHRNRAGVVLAAQQQPAEDPA